MASKNKPPFALTAFTNSPVARAIKRKKKLLAEAIHVNYSISGCLFSKRWRSKTLHNNPNFFIGGVRDTGLDYRQKVPRHVLNALDYNHSQCGCFFWSIETPLCVNSPQYLQREARTAVDTPSVGSMHRYIHYYYYYYY